MSDPRDSDDFLGWAPDHVGLWGEWSEPGTPAAPSPPVAHPIESPAAQPDARRQAQLRSSAPARGAPPDQGRAPIAAQRPTALTPLPPRRTRRPTSLLFLASIVVFAFLLVFSVLTALRVVDGDLTSPLLVVVSGVLTVLVGRFAWSRRPR